MINVVFNLLKKKINFSSVNRIGMLNPLIFSQILL